MIYELGILYHGIPIISRQYYEEYKVDPLLRGGFLSALNSFAEEVFSDEIDSFNMKNFKIIFLSQTFANTKERIFSYCIGTRKISPKVAKRALLRVLEEFNQKYKYLKTLSCDIAIFDEFLPILDEILGDLARSTDERARSVFG